MCYYRAPALSPVIGVRLQDVHLCPSPSHTQCIWDVSIPQGLAVPLKAVCLWVQLAKLSLDFRPIGVMRYLSDCAAINTGEPAPIIHNL